MTIIAVEVKLDTRELDRIMVGLDKNCNQVLGMLAANLSLEAKSKFPPHLDTGNLKSKIDFENPKENYWIVSDYTEYGIHIEFPGIKRAAWPGYPFTPARDALRSAGTIHRVRAYRLRTRLRARGLRPARALELPRGPTGPRGRRRLTTPFPKETEMLTRTALALVIALAPLAAAQAAEKAAPGKSGKEVYDTVCAACHATGVLNAPKMGDQKAWKPLIAEGVNALTRTAIKGIRQMPPRGGNASLTDAEMRRAVVYLANGSGAKFPEPK